MPAFILLKGKEKVAGMTGTEMDKLQELIDEHK